MNVHIFDCDGVIVDSNIVKTEAFKEIGKKFFDENCCDDLIDFMPIMVGDQDGKNLHM